MIITAFEVDLFNVVLLIALALISARVFGYLFDKLKQPAVIGEIVAGIVLGGIAGYQREITNSLLPAIIVHMCFNIGASLVSIINLS